MARGSAVKRPALSERSTSARAAQRPFRAGSPGSGGGLTCAQAQTVSCWRRASSASPASRIAGTGGGAAGHQLDLDRGLVHQHGEAADHRPAQPAPVPSSPEDDQTRASRVGQGA